ncbi:MAG: tetratricopeptide repeat protein [Saprospiraceae bacterium]|nr:tetratricopeptide repeat protein [Saprospiraceae bacterium]
MEEAEKALLLGAELSDHQYPLIFMNLGYVYKDMSRYDDAEKALQKAISLAPLSYDGNYGYVELLLYYLKEPLKAILIYKISLMLDI